jgi:hypothetical protein
MSSWSNLKIELIGVGEQPGTWGNTTNTNLGTAIEEAITGRAQAQFPSNALYTLPYDNSNGSQVFRNLVLNVTSAVNLTGTTDLVIPAIEKQYLVENNTSGSQSIRIKTSAGTGVTIPNGMKAHVFCDGVNTRFADDYVDINGGSIDGTPIGAASASTGAFTTVTATSVTATSATLTAASITGGAVNGTPIGATTASTGAFTTLTATTGTITTGNITTGNISTLNVGTQTNKATISYTTDAARTLTVPAVAGNRTFAFIDEAQTFSAAQTYTANQTVQADLIFSGNSRKIQGNFIAYDNNGTFFQTTVTNQGTALGIIPNGTAGNTSLTWYADPDTTSTSYCNLFMSDATHPGGGRMLFAVESNGTGVNYPLELRTAGFTRLNIQPTGDIGINSTPDSNVSLKVGAGTRTYALETTGGKVKLVGVYGNTVGSTNRTVYIDDTGVIGGLVPSVRAAKTNIARIEDTSWLMALEPVSYNRRLGNNKTGYTDEFNPVTEYGLIADDAVQVRPEICLFDDDNKVAGINYERLITPMLREIQMLRAEVTALKEKLSG